MSLFNAINNNNNNSNNQEIKSKADNYVKRLEELESVVEKQFSEIKLFVPSNPIIGVSAVGVGVSADGDDEEEEEDDDDDDDDDDATREILDMTMDDGGGILDDTDDG
jgi:hypothetical protein